MREILRHGILAFLLGLGLLLSMLGSVGLLGEGIWAAAVLLGLTAALSLCAGKRLTRLILAAVLTGSAAAWLFLLGGMGTLTEILRAATLHFSGLKTAIPMVGMETALLLAVPVALLSYAVTASSVGAYPSLAVTVLPAMLLWLTDQPLHLPWLSPAVLAVIALAATGHQEPPALRRVLPLALGITLAAFLLSPADGVTIQPLKDAADRLRTQILDRFMFTAPRNVFTLASEGYYPQGQNQLGGTAMPTDHPVMLVKTPRRTYLRGSVKNEYTGRMWVDTLAGRRYLWTSRQWQGKRSETFDMVLPEGALGEDSGLMATAQVSVQMLDSNASSLFVPQRVRSLSPGGELIPHFNTGSEIFVTRDLQAGDTYTVTAPLMVAGDAGLGTLIAACEKTADPHYAQVLQDYTSLPDHLQSQLYDLAREICAGTESAYDRAFAIQNYLSRNFRYTLEVEPQPENIDFVSSFLLKTREGYCTYFASAMTVLCRMAGLPARYVEGYLADPDENGHAYVTGLNAHAWTEVYFSGFGWLTFDATPVQSRSAAPPEDQLPPEEQPPEEQPAPEPTSNTSPPEPEQNTPTPEPEDAPPETAPTPEAQDTPEPENEPPREDEPNQEPEIPRHLTWLWWLLALLLLLAAAAARILWTQPKRVAARARDEMGRWSAWLQALHDELRIMGLPRQRNESPIAYMKRLDSLSRIHAELTPVGECMALVFYGHLSPEPEETDMAREAYAGLFHGLTGPQRLRLTLLRAFTPEKKRRFTL